MRRNEDERGRCQNARRGGQVLLPASLSTANRNGEKLATHILVRLDTLVEDGVGRRVLLGALLQRSRSRADRRGLQLLTRQRRKPGLQAVKPGDTTQRWCAAALAQARGKFECCTHRI